MPPKQSASRSVGHPKSEDRETAAASRRHRNPPFEEPVAEGLRKSRILDVAVYEFAENGLAGARVATIAAKAGVNKQLLYYYFGSKKGLYDAVLASVISTARETMSALDQADFKSVTEAFATGVTPTELEHRRLLRRLWMWEALERGATDLVRADDRRAAWAQVTDLLRHGVTQGEIDPRYDVEMLMLAVDAVLNGPWMQPQTTYLVTGLEPDDERFRSRLADFFRQLMAALAPPDPAALDKIGRTTTAGG
jgi:TetR/AcrR family transcriptional regulator